MAKTLTLAQEFRAFISRGNVIDLAIGVIIGGAFGNIVNSIVNDLALPLVGLVVGGINFKDIKILLKDGYLDSAGNQIPAITLNVGNFLQNVITFLIIAIAIFFMVKLINRLHRENKQEEKKVKEEAKEVKLLEEIRDLLKGKK